MLLAVRRKPSFTLTAEKRAVFFFPWVQLSARIPPPPILGRKAEEVYPASLQKSGYCREDVQTRCRNKGYSSPGRGPPEFLHQLKQIMLSVFYQA